LEVEILVVEVGETPEEIRCTASSLTGASAITMAPWSSVGKLKDLAFLRDDSVDDLGLAEAIKLGKRRWRRDRCPIRENTLEVAILDRARPGRKFRRFSALDLRELLAKASLGL